MKRTKYLSLYLLIVIFNAVCIFALADEINISKEITKEESIIETNLPVPSSTVQEPKEETIEIENEFVRLFLPDENKTINIALEDYLVGVLRGEMSENAPFEALKAMAVSARTYTLYMAKQNSEKDWDVVADPGVCQAYVSDTEGINEYKNIKKAISDTQGEVITFEKDIICALYHASSFNKTENNDNVFIKNLSYLTAVDSFESEENVYYFEKTFNPSEFNDVLEKNSLPKLSFDNITLKINYNENKRCGSLTIYDDKTGVVISGRDARSIFGLRSTAFEIEKDDSHITFKVYGFGHGVGLSQNGAMVMSEKGYTYREILSHFYSGTDISKTIYKS